MDRRARREIVVARKRKSVVAKKTVAGGGRIGGPEGDDSIRHWVTGVLFGSEIWRAEKRWMACQRWPDILGGGGGKLETISCN